MAAFGYREAKVWDMQVEWEHERRRRRKRRGVLPERKSEG